MKRCILAVAVTAFLAAAAAAGAASAAPNAGGWFWTKSAAQRYIISHINTSDGERLIEAVCVGGGPRQHRSGLVLWHHFTCDVYDDADREFTVTFQPTSRSHGRAIETKCVDTYAFVSCR